ncbi:MAG: GIY-YIG nuclease family protein [Ruminococcus flavefaciens]|nr:GIY-YIG nuclease family protein [Ruminococcus flavefaciens]
MYYCEEFADKLNEGFKKEYENGTLLTRGRKFKWANKNGVFEVKIWSFKKGAYVTFLVTGESEPETWTIDNFYIIDDVHLKKLFDNAKEYNYNIDSPAPERCWNVKGVYILHDEEEDKYYVGQSKNINKRLREHSYKSSGLCVDEKIHAKHRFKLRCIRLKNSGYSSLDALETAFIAYMKINSEVYNIKRGDIAPQQAISDDIDEKLIII